jgi:protein DJ-1
MKAAKPTVLVPLARGAEEMEVAIIVDVLRRGGVEVVLAGLEGRAPVQCSRGLTIVPDAALSERLSETFDAVVLPGGGEGARRLAGSSQVGELLRRHAGADKTVAAICAAPTALVAHGIGQGAAMTVYPTMRDSLAPHAQFRDQRVVDAGQVVTSQGPGTAFEFALALLERLVSPAKAKEVGAALVLPAASAPR